jgi:hypothetical protein
MLYILLLWFLFTASSSEAHSLQQCMCELQLPHTINCRQVAMLTTSYMLEFNFTATDPHVGDLAVTCHTSRECQDRIPDA